LLGFRQPGPVPFWLNHLDPDVLPWLGDHVVEGLPVLPAAAVLEMALAATRARRPDAARSKWSMSNCGARYPSTKGAPASCGRC